MAIEVTFCFYVTSNAYSYPLTAINCSIAVAMRCMLLKLRIYWLHHQQRGRLRQFSQYIIKQCHSCKNCVKCIDSGKRQ